MHRESVHLPQTEILKRKRRVMREGTSVPSAIAGAFAVRRDFSEIFPPDGHEETDIELHTQTIPGVKPGLEGFHEIFTQREMRDSEIQDAIEDNQT